MFFEVFLLTSTQDLVYFGLWHGSFPAHQWVWMFQYTIFGFWNTASQILLSISSLALIAILSQVDRIPVWMRTRSISKTFAVKVQRNFNGEAAEEL
jgi:hypothetical protein